MRKILRHYLQNVEQVHDTNSYIYLSNIIVVRVASKLELKIQEIYYKILVGKYKIYRKEYKDG